MQGGKGETSGVVFLCIFAGICKVSVGAGLLLFGSIEQGTRGVPTLPRESKKNYGSKEKHRIYGTAGTAVVRCFIAKPEMLTFRDLNVSQHASITRTSITLAGYYARLKYSLR